MIIKTGLVTTVCRSLFFVALMAPGTSVFSFGGGWTVEAREFTVTLRDSVTGKRVSGTVTDVSEGVNVRSFLTDAAGKGSFQLADGRNDLEIEAPGYNSLKTHFDGGDAGLDVTIWLDPVALPNEMRPAAIESRLQNGSTLIHGHLTDSESGRPLANARVYLENAKAEARTDKTGYFILYAATPPVDPAGDLPGSDDLVVEHGGRVIYRRNNILLPDGAIHFIIDANDNTPSVTDATHTLVTSHREVAAVSDGSGSGSGSGDEDINRNNDINKTDQPSAVTVPTSIRVGFTCPTSTTCSTVQVFALDTYVRLGLDDEWISSWNTNSLKAGAIAYRSYGSYYVAHPKTATYDICSTTSCQVIDPNDSAASVDTATAQTTGSIVTDAGGNNVFFAEYAAENNANACPDGFTGSPSAGWSCMADGVDAGQTFNGHGRGMCQWGTQRWSVNQGKDFVWIVNHYYNDNGAGTGLRVGALQLGPNTLLPPPTLGNPGVNNLSPGSNLTSLTPTFDWQPVAGADGYGLYVSKFNGSTYDLIFNSETAVGQPITGTSFTLPAGVLQTSAQYRWNMSAHNAAGYGSANTFRTYFQISQAVTVGGRVFSSDGVTGLRNAIVTMVDPQAGVRATTTSSFGFYSFDNVIAGGSYTLRVASRRFRFQPQTVTPSGDLSDVNFTGLE